MVIPIEAGYPILLWIGIVITAQAFQATPKEHSPAVALGLMPAIAAWGVTLLRMFVNFEGKYTPSQTNKIIVNTFDKMRVIPEIKGIITGETEHFLKANHGGVSSAEMYVPLITISC